MNWVSSTGQVLNTGANVAGQFPGTPSSNTKPFNVAAGAAGLAATGIGAGVAVAPAAFAAGTATTAAGPLAALATAGIFAAIAVPVALLLSKIFHGADPKQVPAAQIQQVFEAACYNLLAIGRAGMLARKEVVDGAKLFLRVGLEWFDRPEVVLGQAEDRAKARLPINVNEVLAAAEGRPVPPPVAEDWLQPPTGSAVGEIATRPLTLEAARGFYIPTNKAGWYSSSLQAAASLTDEYIAFVLESRKQAVAAAEAPVATAAAGVASSLLGEEAGALVQKVTSSPAGTLALWAGGSFLVTWILRRAFG